MARRKFEIAGALIPPTVPPRKPPRSPKRGTSNDWLAYYRYTAKRPPRELLSQTLNHLDWEKKNRRGQLAIDLGFGAGTDSLELLRRGWHVLAIDRQAAAARFLTARVPPRFRAALTILVADLEDLEIPSADLIYAGFSLPFCGPRAFPRLWTTIRRALRPGGHFAGQLFGNEDGWHRDRSMTFQSQADVTRLARGMKIDLIREIHEDGMAFNGPKQWHYFDVLLERTR